MFQFKPDFEKTQQRIEAFWHCELIDRPVVQMGINKPVMEQVPLPPSHHLNARDRWMDAQYQAELALASLSNQEFLGDTLPTTFPNLGPDIFPALYGCELEFGDYGTSWSVPILHDWSEVDKVRLNWESPYLKKLHEMTDALLEIGKDKFVVGMTDWHPGGDCLAALRDPQNLAADMIDHQDEVKALLDRVETDYFQVYDQFYHKLRAAGQPITSWLTLMHDGRYYIPSNDFSIMVSKRMFDEVFLPGIRRECQFLDRSIYHLDGPGAIRHLDSLLAIPELNAIQFVPGSGNEDFERWIHLYQKIQKAGKGIQVICSVHEIGRVMETLDPHGLFLTISGVPDRQTGEALLKAFEHWTAEKVKQREAG
jgi:hypothetical protein